MEVMHLNRECRFPDLSNLFTRTDVTERVHALVPDVPAWLAGEQQALAGALPDVAIGAHCRKPRDCAYLDRCWDAVPPDHISTIHGLTSRQKEILAERGWTRIPDLPAGVDLPVIAARQVRAVRRGGRIVEPTLGDALAGLEGPLAFLDFETINPAIPVWPGCRPYDQIPVQFSCHVEQPDGSLAHIACLVDGAGDTRAEIAHKLVAACAGARHIVAYYMSFERCGVQHLAAAVPELAPELADLERRIVDLWPVVRNHVYDPAFGGSFSIKDVLPALVPGLGYDDLAVRDGSTASVLLGELVLDREMTDIRRAQLRRDLLRYCERDTMAMVELLKALRELAGPQDPQLSLL
jgi:hypothetical protein